MKKVLFLISFLFAGAMLVNAAGLKDDPVIGEPAPAFTLTDQYGNEHSLADFAGKTVMLEWLNHDCPFVVKYYRAGEMQRLQQEYTAKDVIWLSVISSAPGKQGYLEPEEIIKVNEEKSVHSTAVLIDADGTVGRAYGARTTPHMYVIDEDGILRYNGAIDDKPTANAADLEGARVYAAEALDAVLAGNEVEVKTTRPYGCSVKY
jgi:peroxiredoxin